MNESEPLLYLTNLEKISDLTDDQLIMLEKNNVFFQNSKLTDLNGMPNIKYGDFINTEGNLTSLKGSPQKIYGSFKVNLNIKLTNLNFSPIEVSDRFSVARCDLTSLKGCPKEVRSFLIYGNQELHELDELPKSADLIHIYECPILNFSSLVDVDHLYNVSFSYRKDAAILPLIKFKTIFMGLLDSSIYYLFDSFKLKFTKENLLKCQEILIDWGYEKNARWVP